MKGDRELCTAAGTQNWRAHKYATREIQMEKDIKAVVMTAIKGNWRLLKEASEEMKGDRELCTAAVTQDGKVLRWASEEMKNDRELCIAAILRAQQDGNVSTLFEQVLSAKAKDDEDIAVAGI